MKLNNTAILATVGTYSLVSSVSVVMIFMAYNNQSLPENSMDTSLLRGGSQVGDESAVAESSPKLSKAEEAKAKKKKQEDEEKARKARLLEKTDVLVTAPEPLGLEDKKTLLEMQLAEIEKLIDDKSKLWCGRDWKHMVEHCPKQCDEEKDCGEDEDGNPMTCFNMKSELESCVEPGVGVKEPVDPTTMWCGQTWSHALGQCATACPNGDGCPGGELCYGGVECQATIEARKKADVKTTSCVEAADEETCKDTCFERVHSNDCPSATEYSSQVVKKCTNGVKDGELCEADEEAKCNTSDDIDNCSIDSNGYTVNISIYRRVACCGVTAAPPPAKPQAPAVPAEIKAALEKAGVEVFDAPLDELIVTVGNIVGETIDIPTDATTPEIHTKIIAALEKAGITA